jgi:hypothetical protein
MSDKRQPNRNRPANRAERLAAALRANLRRRKAQARGRSAAAATLSERASGGSRKPDEK